MSIYSDIITLFVVMDALGTVPILLSLLKDYKPAIRRKIIIRESAIACVILLVFAFIGEFILHGLGVTTAALSIADSKRDGAISLGASASLARRTWFDCAGEINGDAIDHDRGADVFDGVRTILKIGYTPHSVN
jgi:hypothetical protein